MAISGKRLIGYLLIPAIVILVGVAAFGLGRLSVLKEEKGSLVIHPAPDEQALSHGTHD
jgi:hypothetical protein